MTAVFGGSVTSVEIFGHFQGMLCAEIPLSDSPNFLPQIQLVPEAASAGGTTELIPTAGTAEFVASVIAVSIAVAFIAGADTVSAGALELVR